MSTDNNETTGSEIPAPSPAGVAQLLAPPPFRGPVPRLFRGPVPRLFRGLATRLFRGLAPPLFRGLVGFPPRGCPSRRSRLARVSA